MVELRIVAKLESANTTGSMKDRPARMIVQRAAASSRLLPGGTGEYTAGTTGISLALVASALGYKTRFALSHAFGDEKRFAMLAYGATITDVRGDNKKIAKELIQAMIAKADQISRQPGHWWADQLNMKMGPMAMRSWVTDLAADRGSGQCAGPYRHCMA